MLQANRLGTEYIASWPPCWLTVPQPMQLQVKTQYGSHCLALNSLLSCMRLCTALKASLSFYFLFNNMHQARCIACQLVQPRKASEQLLFCVLFILKQLFDTICSLLQICFKLINHYSHKPLLKNSATPQEEPVICRTILFSHLSFPFPCLLKSQTSLESRIMPGLKPMELKRCAPACQAQAMSFNRRGRFYFHELYCKKKKNASGNCTNATYQFDCLVIQDNLFAVTSCRT